MCLVCEKDMNSAGGGWEQNIIDWMVSSPRNSYVEALTSNAIATGVGVLGGKVRRGLNGGVLIGWTGCEVLEEEKEREIIHSLPEATLQGTTCDDPVRSQPLPSSQPRPHRQAPPPWASRLQNHKKQISLGQDTQPVVVCSGRVQWRIMGRNGTRVTGGHSYRYCKNLRKRYTLIPWSNPGKMKDFKLFVLSLANFWQFDWYLLFFNCDKIHIT